MSPFQRNLLPSSTTISIPGMASVFYSFRESAGCGSYFSFSYSQWQKISVK
ncbi:hypothetical protein B4135_3043 [Caldibacillus debilis]|uniref:Uncharacterized protein n=1 Tax=Caldibacillus debilis TaxID=301148 RepID=A0A150LKF3_9BACI|nr:hypothetical protein B4135_3043 [Caldibacillus debilis]